MDEFLGGLSENALLSLPWLFEFWALPHQLTPRGDWKTWVIMGGRGAGKTRAGAEWVRSEVEGSGPEDPGRCRRVALVGETVDQVREVMVLGDSGIVACSPPDRRPEWHAGRAQLIWPNGAVAQVFSAHEPEAMRGPQFDAAWADEYGCPAIDKGGNQPNRFIDTKSSESGLPAWSNGRRDDLMQMQYFLAVASYWSDPKVNPVSPLYHGTMVDLDHAHAWAWDARPFPEFPGQTDVWNDGENYVRGHWLNGRATNQPLAAVVAELCAMSGVDGIVTDALHGLVRGLQLEDVTSARAALQPLLMAYGFDVVERAGTLVFRSRNGRVVAEIDNDDLAELPEADGPVETTRAPEADMAGQIRVGFVDAQANYEVRSVEARFPDEEARGVSQTDLTLALTLAEGQAIAERWLVEARVARDSVRFALPKTRLRIGAGDIVGLRGQRYRIDRVEQEDMQVLDGVRVEPGIYAVPDNDGEGVISRAFQAPVPVYPVFLDLPLLTGSENPQAPHLAVASEPWPGSVAVWSAIEDAGYQVNRVVAAGAIIGVTETPLPKASPALWDRGAALRIKLNSGALTSVDPIAVLNGANAMAIGDGSSRTWEVLQFADARIVAPGTYELSMRLRGQLGTDGVMPDVWPVGSTVVLLDLALVQIDLPLSARGLARHYRIGLASKGYDDTNAVHLAEAFDGIGLRPYPVAHLRRTAQPTGADLLTWRRRTRIDGDSWQAMDVPMGEEFESYVLRVKLGDETVAEYTVPEPQFLYAAAMRMMDGVTGSYRVEVAQQSAQYGPGPFRSLVVLDPSA